MMKKHYRGIGRERAVAKEIVFHSEWVSVCVSNMEIRFGFQLEEYCVRGVILRDLDFFDGCIVFRAVSKGGLLAAICHYYPNTICISPECFPSATSEDSHCASGSMFQ
jgi:hypothetical protein